MIRHFFLDKTNTIFEGSEQNMGLNPVLQIGYGKSISRGLIHFDIEQIKKLIQDKTFANTDKLKFTLKMTNYFSIDGFPYEKQVTNGEYTAQRANSFDLMLFRVPQEWDCGRGFDYVSDFYIRNRKSYSKSASNWYFAQTAIPWIIDEDAYDIKYPRVNSMIGGILPLSKLKEEHQKFIGIEEKNPETGEIEIKKYPSIVEAVQHFDFGNENLSMDITKYVIDCVNGSAKNYGLCLAFIPSMEEIETETQQYVGFVTDNTNTFFHPYVEANYAEYIMDDRESFTVSKENRLYLYTTDDDEPVNLDEIPTCELEGESMEVKQASKGVYYALIPAEKANVEDGVILYDKWTKIALNGQNEEDVEMEVSTRPKTYKTKIGSDSAKRDSLVPTLYGINDDEKLHRGEIREVTVDFRRKYNTERKELIDSAEYRLYTMDGSREYEVIGWQPIEKAFLNNFFLIYTDDLIPHEYFIDVKVKQGREIRNYRRALRFTVVSDVTERYE